MMVYEFNRQEYFLSTDKRLLQMPVIHSFLSGESYWAKDIPKTVVEKSIENSLCFGIFHQPNGTVHELHGEQVGFARIITDYATFAYLCDVFVTKEHRGRGLSKWMMEKIMAHPDLQQLRRWTLGTKDAHGLYRKFGFREPDNACSNMEIRVQDIYTKMKPHHAE